MSGYREDRSPRCATCEAATPVGELTFNSSGDALCRRCIAGATIDAARAYERKHGMARRCPWCRSRMIGSDERDVRTVMVQGKEETQVSWAHKFTCAGCNHGVRFSPMPVVLVSAAPFVAFGGYLAAIGELLGLLILAPGVLFLLYAAFLRVRYPLWPKDVEEP